MNFFRLRTFAWQWSIAAAMVTSQGMASEPNSIGKQIGDFELNDFRGATHRLRDWSDAPVLVVAFLGTECPLAKLYGPRLNSLAKQFSQHGVAVIGINSNSQDAITEIDAYARRHELDFLILKDVGNHVADQFGATRTPEVFVLDANRTIRYQGRIDDQYGVGYVREEPSRHDVSLAIESLLAGKPVDEPFHEAPGCLIGRVREPQDGASVTFYGQVEDILRRRCVECHREGEIAPFSLTEYDEVSGWADMIAEVVRGERMPPWHAEAGHLALANDRRLTPAERQTLFDWAAAGAPEGDPALALPEPVWTDGWQLPKEPDLVVQMSGEPYEVPAEGAVNYKYFTVDPQIANDRWIKAVEVVPGNRAVVHHILVFADSPGLSAVEFGGGVRGFLAGYVPGLRAAPFPEGMAKRLPKGSKLIFQMHYTPIGTPQTDNSRIGFVFTDDEHVQYEVRTVSAYQPNISIPRREKHHRETTKTRIEQPALLLGMMPHLHLRGEAFEYSLFNSDDQQWSTLLNVPRYDFNWQTNYRLREPLKIPANSYMKCVAQYDNSVDNLSNPNPDQRVGWGEQTWDEMLIGYFDIAMTREAAAQVDATPRWKRHAEEFILQWDENDDFKLQTSELPLRLRLMAFQADEDRDGELTPAELRQAFGRRRR